MDESTTQSVTVSKFSSMVMVETMIVETMIVGIFEWDCTLKSLSNLSRLDLYNNKPSMAGGNAMLTRGPSGRHYERLYVTYVSLNHSKLWIVWIYRPI